MKRYGTGFVLLLLHVGLSATLFAQSGKTADVKSIDAYCKTVDAVRKKRKTPELVFADIAEMDSDKGKWRKFASEKALEKFRETTETYSIAYNWRSGGRIVASNFTLFSGSGDWVKYVYHVFRDDGTLARVDTDFRTFNGDFKVIRRRYFDRDGKQISRSAQFLDLKTGKPKNAGSGVMGDDPSDVDYYKKTSELPFAHLLQK